MGELIHIDFELGERISEPLLSTPEQSFTFSRAVSLIEELGIDDEVTQEAMSFLNEEEKATAIVRAHENLNPTAS